MWKILTKADISAALVCLKGESKDKRTLFTFRSFMIRHNLDNSFRHAIKHFKVYNVTENKWIYEGLITPQLIENIYNYIKNDETDYKKINEAEKKKRSFTKILKTLKKYDVNSTEIYIRTDVYSQKIPTEIISKGIDIGNGIFIINLKYLQEHESANASN